MNTNPYDPPASESKASSSIGTSSTSSLIVNFFKWAQWSLLSFFVLLVLMFSYKIDPEKNHWALNITGIAILIIFIPLSLSVGLILLKRIANPWLNVIIYGFGLFITFVFISCGFFAVLSGDFTVLLTSFICLLLYCPLINNKLTSRSTRPLVAD